MARDHHSLSFRNTGTVDRWARFLLGVLLIGFGWWSSWTQAAVPMRVFGLYPLITAVIAWCPIYALLRVRSDDD